MPLNLASPGIVVREVDLTIGRVDPVSGSIGALVAPFAKGPVDLPQFIENEDDLLDTFGRPYSVDKHYEHWMVASSYLAYGGTLRVSRADDAGLKNAGVGTDRLVGTGNTIKIKSTEHYEQLGYDENPITSNTVVARNPGTWANGIKVAIIDAKADQVLSNVDRTHTVRTFTTAQSAAGTVGITTNVITGITTTGITPGQEIDPIADVIASGVTVASIGNDRVVMSADSLNTVQTSRTFNFGTSSTSGQDVVVGMGVTVGVAGLGTSFFVDRLGNKQQLDGYIRGVVTELVGTTGVAIKLQSRVSAAGTVTDLDYAPGTAFALGSAGTIHFHGANDAVGAPPISTTWSGQLDWFEQQNIELSVGKLEWDQLANRPGTSEYAAARGGRFDEVHVVVIDDKGTITGNAGTILEKHLSLSKAKDAEFSVGSPSYWRKYLYTNSQYIFGGFSPSGTISIALDDPTASNVQTLDTNSGWDFVAANRNFGGCGVRTLTLGGGLNYQGKDNLTESNSLYSGLDDIKTGLGRFENTEEYEVDFILMGSANYAIDDAAALATKCVAVAEARKDAVAFVSPYRGAFITDNSVGSVTVENVDTITDNVLAFANRITSSTYAVIDSGYKYMYDRFNDTFRYVPLNGDIAGTCARTDINQFPWFSPAGTSRGAILNAVKLAYNPGKKQRDQLYSARVNPVIFSPGAGIILFGDKTAFGKSSAFDRINVRRLFIFLEDAISAAAKDFLFEFNDEITRTNFVNIVEPFLRDVQSKRGIQDYVVICDETNNTAAIIDSNEFVADIFIKPARSINFIGLTFIATRTGVAFEEVIGSV